MVAGRGRSVVVRLLVAVSLSGVVGALPARAQPPAVRSPAAVHGVAVEKNVLVTVRDGVKLAADVYRPARDGVPLPGRFPTLLTRTPYDKSGAEGDARYYAERG